MAGRSEATRDLHIYIYIYIYIFLFIGRSFIGSNLNKFIPIYVFHKRGFMPVKLQSLVMFILK